MNYKMQLDPSNYIGSKQPISVGDEISFPNQVMPSGCLFTCIGIGPNNTIILRKLSENSKLMRIEYWYYTRYYAITYSIINSWKTLSLKWSHKLIH